MRDPGRPRIPQLLLLVLAAPPPVAAQRQTTFEERPATILENDRIELAIWNRGGAFVNLVLKDDPARNNPMWNPTALTRKSGAARSFGDSHGHFVCVDGFGPTSPEEAAAGLEGHGEAHRQPWELVEGGREGKVARLRFRVRLPIVQEVLTRQLELADGENVVYVESELENLLGFDRPINWAEHGTIGAPFLASDRTVVDASVGACLVRPNEGRAPSTLAGGREFAYPAAPLRAGGSRDLRSVPQGADSMDHIGCLMDESRRLVFVTALDLDRKLLLGYLWRREESPWLQQWLYYPASGALARGLEFGTQPFDVSRRETVDMGRVFGRQAFRWLPAKSRIRTRFAMFWTRTPEGLAKVDDVRLDGGALVIEDRRSGKRVTLRASLPL